MTVHNEEARAARGIRTMRVGAVRDLVAHAGREREGAAILEVGGQFTVDAEQDVAFLAPVVGLVARRIVDHPHANVAELARPPRCGARLARMHGRRDRAPVGRSERDAGHLHAHHRSIVPVRRIFFCNSITP
jgi:hypothetical protein